jgi:hypothetical protein
VSRSNFTRSAFARTLTAHMCEWRARYDGSNAPIFGNWIDGVYPAFRDEATTAIAEDEVRLHDFAAAVTSSQMFALNLFMPWRSGTRGALEVRLARVLGTAIAIERVGFEWVPPGALLGEIDGDRPRPDEPATAVDVVLWGRDGEGARVALLLEVKLSEEGFTNCNGRESRGNRRPDVCASATKFFGDPADCYLRRPVRRRRDRRYWEIFGRSHGSVRAAFPGADESGPCPFAGHQQQPMRNLALAYALMQEGVVDRAWFGLCPHDQNPDVAREWTRWRALLPAAEIAPVLPASEVLAAGRDAGHGEWAQWMADRYRLAVR